MMLPRRDMLHGFLLCLASTDYWVKRLLTPYLIHIRVVSLIQVITYQLCCRLNQLNLTLLNPGESPVHSLTFLSGKSNTHVS